METTTAQAQGGEEDGGWFAWALPTSMTEVAEEPAQGGTASVEIGAGGGRPAATLADDTNNGHLMTRQMVTTHADQFNSRLDKELAVQAKAIEDLRDRVEGGTGRQSVMDDVQAIIDVMRRDLNSQRELLMQVNEQLPTLRDEVQAIRSGGALDEGVVSLKQHEQAFNALQADMNSLHRATELAAVKAGFLAVASSECSLEERATLFETLKAKEQALQHGHANPPVLSDANGVAPKTRSWDQAPAGSGGTSALARSEMVSPPPQVAAAPASPQSQQNPGLPARDGKKSSERGAAEFMVRLDKSRGDPLGLQIDHEDGSTLLVDAIFDGLVKWWNDANPELAVLPGDRIVAVNGKRGNIDMLLRETEAKMMLTLVILRMNK